MRKARFSVPINHTPSSPRVETKKKEYLINKFNLTKETIQVDDIKELINKLNSFNIENIKIETAQLIFNMLDKKKKRFNNNRRFYRRSNKK